MKHLYKIFYPFAFILSALCGGSSTAQQTGSFDRTVNFAGNPSWALSYYVPPTYNASKKYKLLIGLHALGQGNKYYRDWLKGVSGYTTLPNAVHDAIMICPYAGTDANTDYWSPVSDTGIITKAIADAMSAYNIDPDQIYLNGFSLGGRSALRYGLLNPKRFRGLILFAPAIQSTSEANNLTSFKYEYRNGKYIPICMTVGSDDGYGSKVSAAYQHLIDSGGVVNLKIVYGLGHTTPPNPELFGCFSYLDESASSGKATDAALTAISSPFDEECDSSFTPVVSLQNKGKDTLKSAYINYRTDNSIVNIIVWNGNLAPLASQNITLPFQTASMGSHLFLAYVSSPNGAADSVSYNDSLTVSFNSIAKGADISQNLSQGFESATFPPAGWNGSGTDNAWKWQRKSSGKSGGYGQSASCLFFDNAVPNNSKKKYSIRTPQYDFSAATNPGLYFDYAYAPYKSGSSVGTDTLVVYYSTDCGATWMQLQKKGGVTLSTTGGFVATVFVPTAGQWKTDSVSLKNLVGQPRVMFSFEDVSDWGNLLYLDNIRLNGVTTIGVEEQTSGKISFDVYPNPNNGRFTLGIEAPERENVELEITNVMGQVVYSEKLNDLSGNFSRQIDISEYGGGLFFVNLNSMHNEMTKKVVCVPAR